MKTYELMTHLKNVRAVIFDVDGVILDSMPIWRECDELFLRKKGKDPDPHLYEILFPLTLEEGLTYLKTTYDLQESMEEISQEIQDIVADAYRSEIPAKEGMVELIRFLHEQGTLLLIMTSNEREPVEAAMKRLGIDSYFEEMLFCSEVGAGKGTPLIFQKAAQILKSDYRDIYVVEDGLYSMKTAKNLGMKVIGVYDQASAQDQPEIMQLADYYIKESSQK